MMREKGYNNEDYNNDEILNREKQENQVVFEEETLSYDQENWKHVRNVTNRSRS